MRVTEEVGLFCIFMVVNTVALKNETVSEQVRPIYFRPSHTFKTKEYQIVVPEKVNAGGQHLGYVLRHFHNKHEPQSGDKIHYAVEIDGEPHVIELRPNRRLLSPAMVAESYQSRNVSEMMSGGRKRRRCHYLGRVRGHKLSRVALSTCNGLSGYIRTSRGVFMIEPQSEKHDHSLDEPHPHLVYRHSQEEQPFCAITESDRMPVARKRKRQREGDKRTTTEGSTPQQLHIEALVVLDHAILNYHKAIDIENFVLTVFNIAHDLFHDASLGIDINLAIVRMIRLEVEDHEMNIAVTRNVGKTMQHFRMWQKKINPKQDIHPNHHDVAILLTRIEICADDKSCGFLGAARFAGMCDPENDVVIAQDNGLVLGFTIAHEIGHTLGMMHDLLPKDKDVDLLSYQSEITNSVMSPHISSDIIQWSDCSRQRLQDFIDSGFGSCLYDAPTDHSFILADALPGVLYDGDFQCREMFGPNSALCMTGVECSNLICYVEDKGCIESHTKAADGTMCGENKWCFRGECVEMGERPGAVDGGWGPWSEWSECTRTCGSGVASQGRRCNNPAPKLGGKYCPGETRRFKICSTLPCDLEQPSFRDVQCAEFNSWAYPGDGLVHQWKSYPVHDENQCALYCVNDLGNVASLRPRVIDGTTCYRGIRDICINGICKEIPCDLDLESSAVEDRCGICKGNGTSCRIIRGEHAITCSGDEGYEKLIMEVPKGAFNIKLEEQTPSESSIQVRDKDGTTTFISGEALGMFSVNGVNAWVGMIRTKQEGISIPGPIKDVIGIWGTISQNSTLMFSYALNASEKRQPSFSWDYVDWSRCSADCGPGIQQAVGKCVEKEAGLVDDSFCKSIPRITEQIRPCEIATCTPKWFVGEWSDCSRCPLGQRTRLVKCFKQIGHGEGELDIVSDAYCANPKPKNSEFCACRKSIKRQADVSSTTPTYDMEALLSTTTEKNYTMFEIKNIYDAVNVKNLHLTVHTELEKGKFPAGLPHPKTNESSYEVRGKEALKFLNAIQADFSNNRTRI